MTYLITFSSYGWHLHGHEYGSVDRLHNVPRARVLDSNPKRSAAERQLMKEEPYSMDRRRREVVLNSIGERCAEQGWILLAAHVRTSHVHIVVEGAARPERIMNDLKSYASRRLNQMGLDGPGRKRWSRHGSTRWLWRRENISAAIRYVVDAQGAPMSVFEADGS